MRATNYSKFIVIIILPVLLLDCTSSKNGTSLNGKKITVERDHGDRSPLYVVNGTVLTSKKARQKYIKVKPHYFSNVNILDVKEATKKYGSPGKFRAIETTITDSIKAFNDLLETYNGKGKNSSGKIVLIDKTTEPKLLGGLRNLQRKVEYPKECKQANAQGRVIVAMHVDIQGNVQSSEVLRGIGWGCDGAALQAANTARFLPGIDNGKPVQVRYSIPVMFRLN